MRLFNIFIITFSFSINASPDQWSYKLKEDQILCAYHQATKISRVLNKSSLGDKTKHCIASCLIAKRCNATDAMTIGLLKEIKDLLGDGHAEVSDLKANYFGIRLSHKITHEKQCREPCLLRYER